MSKLGRVKVSQLFHVGIILPREPPATFDSSYTLRNDYVWLQIHWPIQLKAHHLRVTSTGVFGEVRPIYFSNSSYPSIECPGLKLRMSRLMAILNFIKARLFTALAREPIWSFGDDWLLTNAGSCPKRRDDDIPLHGFCVFGKPSFRLELLEAREKRRDLHNGTIENQRRLSRSVSVSLHHVRDVVNTPSGMLVPLSSKPPACTTIGFRPRIGTPTSKSSLKIASGRAIFSGSTTAGWGDLSIVYSLSCLFNWYQSSGCLTS